MKNNNGSFVPVPSNWSFDFPGSDVADASSCAPRTPRQKAAQRNAAKKNTACAAEACQAAPMPETSFQMNAGQNTGYQPQLTCAANACTGQADCPCEACAQRRAAQQYQPCQSNVPTCPHCGCTGQADCRCETCVRQRAACASVLGPAAVPGAACPVPAQPCGANAAIGMVYAAWQTLADTFDADSALTVGTLFPELHKPLNGYGPCGENCATRQQKIAFVAWELRLFLDTHPNDARALALMQRVLAEARGTYAAAFLGDCTDGWNWINAPWPWELDANCC